MTALAMQIELKKLALRHGATSEPCILPLTAPVPYDIIIEGLAATGARDRSFQKFRPYAFGNPCLRLKGFALPRLLFRHTDPAGELLDMHQDARGLWVRARVTHAEAKR